MTDYTEYKKLYLLCFTDDTEEDAEFLFKNVLSKANCVCEYDEKGYPISMLFLMDSEIVFGGSPFPYYYLYAACTRPDYRGKGIMGRLLDKAREEAIKNNKNGIFLKPANKSLFDFYAKYKFTPYFKVSKIEASILDFTKDYIPCSNGITEVSLDEWHSIRKAYLKDLSDGYVDFSKEILSTAADGSIAIKSENFGFVYEKRDSLLLVKEALCKKECTNSLFSAISYIAKETNTTKLEIRLPITLNDNTSYFKEAVQDFSVIWLSPKAQKQTSTTPYHGFAFD